MISDTSPLIIFAKAGRLSLLQQVVGTVTVPMAVWNELVSDESRLGAAQLLAADWIERDPGDADAAEQLQPYVGAGEAEAIALALQSGQPLLMDDKRARKVAESLGVGVVGCVGVLLAAKKRRLIRSVHEVLEELVAAGLRIGASLRDTVLQEANEA